MNDMAPLDTSEGARSGGRGGGTVILGVGYWMEESNRCDRRGFLSRPMNVCTCCLDGEVSVEFAPVPIIKK